ncbi:MAG: tRNA (adenosine(37)-N6)-dimethylallyltransferase MiaA [Anaerolineae bacterium]|nr:tRNA (adenosine(37)-N6)-dimethylallyltransferase MiaA [Anaerolineae bacterium]
MTETATDIPLVAIVGPTAVGKTALAATLAESVPVEVVSADSRQCYRWMDIGTAKPLAERKQVQHHLIDIADPDETVGLAQFLQLAQAAIANIAARRKLPLLVGGTGQYVRGLLQGWQVPEVPPDPALRAMLEQQSGEALWAQLLAQDPAAGDFIDPRNLRRVIRALEVIHATGRPFSEQRRHIPPPYRVLQIGLTLERSALYARADARVEAMMATGLPVEVENLLARGYGWELPSMSGLGYGQFRPFFAGQATLAEVAERIKLDTHDFIRRQYAWFRPNAPDIHWLSGDANAPQAALRMLDAFLQ